MQLDYQIHLSNWYVGGDYQNCNNSVDETDVQITEPSPFCSNLLSYKLRGSGLRYELGASIHGGHIVWIYRPFRPGEFNDVQTF